MDHYTYLQYFVTPGGRLRRGTYRDRFTDFQLLIDQRGSMFTGEAYLSGLPSDPALPRNTGDFCHFHSPMLSDAWIDEMAERCLAALLEPPQDRR